MCVIFFAYKIHPEFPLILLANRDEFYERPTEKAQNWTDFPNIFGGRDLVGGGTWLGINSRGKFAAVTNFRQPNQPNGKQSRGNLTADFLKTDESAAEYLKKIEARKDDFSGFNLLVGEISASKDEIFYFSNRSGEIKKLSGGIYGLSNHLFDTPWRKIEKGKRFLRENLNRKLSKDVCFQLLQDESLADDADLPDTGIGYEREKLLSAIFIKTPIYGTRCSSILTVDRKNRVSFSEKTFVGAIGEVNREFDLE